MSDEQLSKDKNEFEAIVAFRMKVASADPQRLLQFVLDNDIRNAQMLLKTLEAQIEQVVIKLKSKNLEKEASTIQEFNAHLVDELRNKHEADLKKFQQWRILTKEMFGV